MTNQNEFIYGIAVSSSSLLFAMFVLAGFLLLAILVAMMRIYKKAKKPSISAIVPIWSQIVLFQIVGKPWWYFFLLLVPIVNVVIFIQIYILLAKKFGKGVGFGIAMIFLPMIFIPLLSFYDYIDENITKETDEIEQIYNPFNQTDVSQVMPVAPQIEQTNEVVKPVINDSVVEPVQENLNVGIQENAVSSQNNELIIPEIPVEPTQQVLNNTYEESTQSSKILSEAQNVDIPIIPEVMPNVNTNLGIVNDENELSKIETQEILVEDSNIQDIQTVLNTNNLEPKNVAFNSIPIISEPVILQEVETLEPLSENKIFDTTVIEKEEVNNDIIEMPEIAAKTCPACGISLAEDIKFCTSCGTQL